MWSKELEGKMIGQRNLEDIKLEISFVQTVLYFHWECKFLTPVSFLLNSHSEWGFVQLSLTWHQCKPFSKHSQRITTPIINQAFHSFSFPGVKELEVLCLINWNLPTSARSRRIHYKTKTCPPKKLFGHLHYFLKHFQTHPI